MVARLQWFALLLAASVCAQDQEPLSTLRITVTLVQVDAVVTDSRGRRVTGLGREDFELLQNGVPQKITYFSYVPEAPPPSREKLPIGPAAPVTPAQIKRTVALVVDDLALSFENLVRTRESLRTFIERQMQPGDLAAIVRTGGGVAILEQFTTDRRILLAAVDAMKWRFYGRVGLIPIDPLRHDPLPRGEPEILDYGHTLSALGALGTLEQVVRGMKALPGRKSVVFFSDNFRADSELSSAMDHVTDLCNRSAVSLYSIDPGGLRTYSLTAADNVDMAGPSSGSILGDLMASRAEEVLWSQQGLSYLARRTGGLFFGNNNDIPGCIRQAVDDQLGYYLLGYSPQEGTFEEDRETARFHRISVRVRRPGAQVRWKTGFTGVPDPLPGTDEPRRTREQQLLDALASPFTATGLKVRLTALYLDGGASGPHVHTMLHFDGRDLAFKRQEDGLWHAAVDVVISQFRGVKQAVQQGQRTDDIRLSDHLYQQALKEGFLYRFNYPVKAPGPFLMRAVVRDAVSERIGSASQFVEVPNTRKGQLAVSGIKIEIASPELIAKEQPRFSEFAPVEAWSEGGPAVRRFRPGHVVVYAFMVINPKLKNKATDVVSQMRLFRDGKLVYTGPEHTMPANARMDERRYVAAGLLRLGTRMVSGEYLMQVAVTDRNAKKKQSQVQQWGDFEVTEAPGSR